MAKPFWNRKWDKTNKCPITQTRLRPGKNKWGIPYTIRLNCGHRFCRSAIFNWVKKSQIPTCPMCRGKIFLIDLITNKT